MATNLEVDAFEIDLETLATADLCTSLPKRNGARQTIIEAVIENLDPDSRKRLGEYQAQNDPCRLGGKE